MYFFYPLIEIIKIKSCGKTLPHYVVYLYVFQLSYVFIFQTQNSILKILLYGIF